MAIDLVRGPRRSSSMDSLPHSRPRRSPWSWSRRSPWLGPWVGVLGPPPSPWVGRTSLASYISCTFKINTTLRRILLKHLHSFRTTFYHMIQEDLHEMPSFGPRRSFHCLYALHLELDVPPLWPRRSSLSPRRSWFGFGCSCLGFCICCEVVLGPLPSSPPS